MPACRRHSHSPTPPHVSSRAMLQWRSPCHDTVLSVCCAAPEGTWRHTYLLRGVYGNEEKRWRWCPNADQRRRSWNNRCILWPKCAQFCSARFNSFSSLASLSRSSSSPIKKSRASLCPTGDLRRVQMLPIALSKNW